LPSPKIGLATIYSLGNDNAMAQFSELDAKSFPPSTNDEASFKKKHAFNSFARLT